MPLKIEFKVVAQNFNNMGNLKKEDIKQEVFDIEDVGRRTALDGYVGHCRSCNCMGNGHEKGIAKYTQQE